MAYLLPINDDLHNNSSYCEKFREIFLRKILIVDKTRPRKDLIFFRQKSIVPKKVGPKNRGPKMLVQKQFGTNKDLVKQRFNPKNFGSRNCSVKRTRAYFARKINVWTYVAEANVIRTIVPCLRSSQTPLCFDNWKYFPHSLLSTLSS